jgi:hypothetical protein
LAGRKEPRSIYRIFGKLIFFYTLRPVDDAVLQAAAEPQASSHRPGDPSADILARAQ